MEIKLIKPQRIFLDHKDDLEYAFLAGVGTGKSFIAAFWVFYRTFQLKERIFVGSQQWSTTRDVQFKAIIDLLDSLGIKEDVDYKYNKSDLTIAFTNGGFIKGVASAAKNAVTGYTKFNGAWFDEAYLWDVDAKNYVMGRCRNCIDSNGELTDARFRYTGTPPLEPTGWYYDWLMNHPDRYVRGSTEDSIGKYNPPSYLEQQIDAYGGRTSPLCRIQVFGELPSAEATLSIFKNEHHVKNIPMSMGIDCSGGNNGDEASFCITDGEVLHTFGIKEFNQKELLAKAQELASIHNVKQIRIDTTGGYGIALCESLQDLRKYEVTGINFGQSAYNREAYANARAEMYDNCSKTWNDNWGDIFQRERFATSVKLSNGGKLQLIGKDEIKKLIGHSPDGLDALCLALYTNDLNPDYVPLQTKEFWNKHRFHF